jgi:uncharacterized membrane protein YfcA
MGLVVGAFSGLFGVGGGVILVPLLVLLFGVNQKRAQATSLVVVAFAATTGALTYALGQSVVWESVMFLLVGGLFGTWLGSQLVQRIETRWLQVFFALLLLAAAIGLIVPTVNTVAASVPELGFAVIAGYVAIGFVMGTLSALLGVGGGVVVIPLLVTFFGFTQQLAAGTSLVVMIPVALVGAWQLSRAGQTNWGQGIRIGAVAAVGSVAGASLALTLDPHIMQRAFAAVLILVACHMLWKGLVKPGGTPPIPS